MNDKSLKSKIWLGLCFGLVVGETFRRLATKYIAPFIPPIILLAFAVLLLIAGLILPYLWHSGERQKRLYSCNIKAQLEYAIIYALALDLVMFGFHKIEGLQMIVPLGMLDTPFSSFSGENLVWAFFRFSYPFTVFIALLQISTATFLLFSKTRLFGLILAVPILTFVTCLDIFYQMPLGVLIHGLILLMGVSYFLYQDKKRLIHFIFRPLQGVAVLKTPNQYKNAARISVLIFPLVFHAIYDYPDKHPELTGKYHVKSLKINDISVSASSPKDSVLTTVYLDLKDEIVFYFNDYRYIYIGNYFLNKTNDSVVIHWRYPSNKLDDFNGKLKRTEEQLILSGRMNDKTLQITLMK